MYIRGTPWRRPATEQKNTASEIRIGRTINRGVDLRVIRMCSNRISIYYVQYSINLLYRTILCRYYYYAGGFSGQCKPL